MTTTLLGRLRAVAGLSGDDQDAGLRRVGTRLAAQSVILLLVMLAALELFVYITAQHTLLGSLESTLHDQVHPPPFMVQDLQRHANSPDDHRPRPHLPNHGPSDTSTVYLDRNLRPLDGGGPLGQAVIDPAAARAVLRTGREVCCPTQRYHGEDYLIYTAAVHDPDNGAIFAVAQATVSARQYEATLGTLRHTLLLVALLGLLVAGLISLVVTRRALQPIRVAVQRQRDFVADAAHELRTPLSIMRTVGEVALTAPPGEEQGDVIEQMLVENRHLTRLVDDLSLLARADSQAVPIERAPLDLAVLVSGTAEELTPLAADQGVVLATEVRGSAPMQGDLLRLRQLLLILLDNALKHTPEGGRVAVQLRSHGNQAVLRVTDSGPGIDPADLPHIFDRFYRADRARTGEGSGLGLAIGKWIVESHGGHVTAGNSLDGGAVFTVSLPLGRTGAPVGGIPSVATRRT